MNTGSIIGNRGYFKHLFKGECVHRHDGPSIILPNGVEAYIIEDDLIVLNGDFMERFKIASFRGMILTCLLA